MSCASEPQDLITNDLNKTNIETQEIIDKAADLVLSCEAILFTSGAGMGVSSGFGTFRGIAADVWSPLLQHPELDYIDMCNTSWFRKPQGNSCNYNTANFGYTFWTHRYNTYTSTAPHRGYFIAKQWSELNHFKSAFSFTSNIDGHWIKSGWNESSVLECHGSIDYMQCVNNCRNRIWPTNDILKLTVDPNTNCVIDRLPSCPNCHGLARPNVFMFNDGAYLENRKNEQISHYKQFKLDVAAANRNLLVIELGAGTAIPTVRRESERVFTDERWTAHLIRINPLVEHSKINVNYQTRSKGQAIELSMDALTALTLIDEAMKNKIKNKEQIIELSMDTLTAPTLIDETMKNKIKRPKIFKALCCCAISQK
jgi:NAD-dependent SIR2 family protein deacetylase